MAKRYQKHKSPSKHRSPITFRSVLCVVLVGIGGCFLTHFLGSTCAQAPIPSLQPIVQNINYTDVYGIDVSSHQGYISWDKVCLGIEAPIKKDSTFHGISNYPITFAFVKATEGATYNDKLYHRNVEEARKAGIVVGSYHYYKPNRSAKRQAQHFLGQASLLPGDLPPAIDVEEQGALSSKQLCDSVYLFLRHLERRTGAKPFIYANAHFMRTILNDKRLKNYRVWVAHYNKDAVPTKDMWHFWQFTDRGNVTGISVPVDVNVFVSDCDLFDEILM